MKFKNMCIVLGLCIVIGLTVTPKLCAVEVGDKAPDFELPSTQGGKLKLSSFQGKKKVLLEFYVLDFTAT